ncbi:MAG TPA: hypothetical protein VG453_01300, partial [Nitrospira sp.]|nr:hypothetical protein [Nitrospira sp.]
MPDRDDATNRSKEVKPPAPAGPESKPAKDERLISDELESIRTVVPREGDGYRRKAGTGVIGEAGRQLTNEDLQRINTRKGLLQLLQQKSIDLEEVRKTLLYEEELKCLQVELVRLQRWVQSSGRRIAIIVEGRDAAGKGGTIRR